MKIFNVCFDDENAKIVDEYRKKNGNINRSKFLEMAALDYIKAKTIEPELKIALESLASSFEELAKKADSLQVKK